MLEQQAHSQVSGQSPPETSEPPSAPSTSSQPPSPALGSPASTDDTAGSQSGATTPTPEAGAKSLLNESTIIPLRGYKRAMVQSMITAGAIPHFHFCDELDMRALMALRTRIKDDSMLQGVHLTFLPIMIKVSKPEQS